MQLNLITQNIKDPMVREAFNRLLQWIALQPLMNSDFKFFELDIVQAQTNLPVAHGLSYIPKDVILLSAIGDQRFYFIYQKFDKTNIYVTNSGPVRIRFLAGSFQSTGLNPEAVNFPFVAP